MNADRETSPGVPGLAMPEESGFVLDLASNPHADLLADALMIRANCKAAEDRLGALKDYEIDWRCAWRFTRRAMAKATGRPESEFDAWLDHHEAGEVACEISEGE